MRDTCGDESGGPTGRWGSGWAGSPGLHMCAGHESPICAGDVGRASRREAMKIAQGKALGMRFRTIVAPRRGGMIPISGPNRRARKRYAVAASDGCRSAACVGVNHAGPAGRRVCGVGRFPGRVAFATANSTRGNFCWLPPGARCGRWGSCDHPACLPAGGGENSPGQGPGNAIQEDGPAP